jgi:hypothetical protein
MPPGRPKGSTNQVHDYPQGQNPPANWSKKIEDVVQIRHALKRDGGPNLPSGITNITPYNVFRLLWSDNMDQHLIKRTNKRGSIKLTSHDLHRFLLAGLLMCITARSIYTHHSSSMEMYEDRLLKKVITKNDFRECLRHLHPKPKQLVTLANSNFQKYWKPFVHLSVDEGLICFKGRYQHRVHIRGKPDATGLKIYALADEKAYLYAFALYNGESHSIPDIVSSLVDQLPDFNHKIYLDSWYGSLQLASNLMERSFFFTLACGKNKPAELFDQ